LTVYPGGKEDKDMTIRVNDIGDKWIFIDCNTDCNDYYCQDSVIKKDYCIKVWIKRVYNQGNKILEFIKLHINNDHSDDIHHSFLLYSIDYINYKYCIESILHYNSDEVLLVSVNPDFKFKEIKPDSKVDKIYKQINNR
jgi:hypothetical protein